MRVLHERCCGLDIHKRFVVACLLATGPDGAVNGADTDNSLWQQPEGPGLSAVADGFLNVGLGDDQQVLASEFSVCDALYGYCQAMVERGTPNGAFKP